VTRAPRVRLAVASVYAPLVVVDLARCVPVADIHQMEGTLPCSLQPPADRGLQQPAERPSAKRPGIDFPAALALAERPLAHRVDEQLFGRIGGGGKGGGVIVKESVFEGLWNQDVGVPAILGGGRVRWGGRGVAGSFLGVL